MTAIPNDSAAPPAARPNRFWPRLVIGLLAGQLLLTGVAVLIATSDRSFAVEPDYYRQALQWDQHRAQLAHNATLGWHAAADVAADATPSGARRVLITLTDRSGAPLEQARVHVTSFAHARAQDRTESDLLPEPGGRYAIGLPLRRPGLWEFRITVERDGETFTAVECLDVSAARRSR
jgi:hypothetical protein